MHRLVIIWAAACLLIFSSCDSARVYEQNEDLEGGDWSVDNALVFKFEIQDTSQAYDVFFNVRYKLQYSFYNLYIQHQLRGPDGKLLSAKLHEMLLMDAKTGKPLGKGFSDTYDLQARALRGITFPEAGTYTIKLTQYMRQDPLTDILSLGIRIANSEKKP
jgi:gliding motility-associated lipoprotein GldH